MIYLILSGIAKYDNSFLPKDFLKFGYIHVGHSDYVLLVNLQLQNKSKKPNVRQ